MTERKVHLRDFDGILLLAALGLAALGTMLIYSGTLSGFGSPSASDLSHPVVRQATFIGLGLLLALGIASFDYRALGTLGTGLYIASIATLVFVLVVGDDTYGSRRWILIGDTAVQPSEIAKLVIIIVLAKYLSDRRDSINRLPVFLTSLALAALPTALVLAEPDLGSAVIFGAIWLVMVTVAGADWRHLLGLAGAAAVSFPFLTLALQGYQRERISLWLDPESDPLGGGFNILQARISIGSGGIFGKGLTDGTQTQLNYLRTETTDYVFSVLGEELGFLGAMVLFALFVVLLWRCLRAGELSRDLFGRLLATGIVIFILLQTFINIGVNIGLLPVTGIPLPFVSQGGSSLVTLFIGIGVLQSVLLRHRRPTFHELFET